jgi:hypothetical protein
VNRLATTFSTHERKEVMEKRFGVLRFIGTLYKILGGIVGVVTLLGAVGFCIAAVAGGAAFDQLGGQNQPFGGMMSGLVGGIIAAVVFFLYGGAAAISLFAAGEGVYLLISLEENTRLTSQLLQQRPPQTPGV